MIKNGASITLDQSSGTLPQVGEAMLNWFQAMVFGVVTKTMLNGILQESVSEVTARGVMQALSMKRLELKPEGQRAWEWQWLHVEPALDQKVDDKIIWDGRTYRIMAKKEYRKYGYIEYELVEDYYVGA